jgi:hypothetical protein
LSHHRHSPVFVSRPDTNLAITIAISLKTRELALLCIKINNSKQLDGEKANGVEPEESKSVEAVSEQYEQPPSDADAQPRRTSVSKISKIILTSYPGQAGVDPLPMQWGAKDPAVRGPVVVSRHANTIRRRNGM